MKLLNLITSSLLVLISGFAFAGSPTFDAKQSFDNQHWAFTQNKGQLTDEKGQFLSDVKFYSHSGGPQIYCRPGMVSFVFTKTVDKSGQEVDLFKTPAGQKEAMNHRRWMEDQISGGKLTIVTSRTDLVLLNANPAALIAGDDKQTSYENFYSAYTPEAGVNYASTFKTVAYKNIYPHIDMLLHAREGGIEYEFVVNPGGNPADIQMQWKGLDNLETMQDGGIHYTANMIDMQDSKPVSFTTDHKSVASSFSKNDNVVSFSVGNYDHSQTLTIDPIVVWGTYLSGGTRHYGQAVWTDHNSNVLMCGPSSSTSAVGTSGSYQSTFAGSNSDAFLAKFNSSGALQWCTYYGGTGYNDGWGLNDDLYNDIYMGGATSSSSGISTSGSFQTAYAGASSSSYNGYFVKFTTAGTRVWASYFGSTVNDQVLFIATDANANVFTLAWTSSTSGIASSGAYQTSYGGGAWDFGLAKYDSSGKKQLWATYFGGSSDDLPNNCATDAAGNVIVVGGTTSTGLATSGAYQTSYGGGQDALIASFSPSGGLNWSTYLGGSASDYAWGNVCDNTGHVIITGQTFSSSGVATSGAYQTSLAGTANAFVSQFDNKGKMIWSTYYGGTGTELANNVSADNNNNIYITGSTTSANGIATADGLFTSLSATSGNSNAFLAKFDSTGKRQYGTYYGGKGSDIAWDVHIDPSLNVVYLTGQTASTTGIATYGSHSYTYTTATEDAFLAAINMKNYSVDAGVASIVSPRLTFCAGTNTVKVKLTNYGSNNLTSATIGWTVNKNVQTPYSWTGKLLKDSSTIITIGAYSFPARADSIVAWTTKPNGLIDSLPQNDTSRAVDTAEAYPKANAGGNKTMCAGATQKIGTNPVSGYSYSWTSKPSGFTSTSSLPTVTPTVNTTYYLTVKNVTGCASVDSSSVTVGPIPTPNAGGNHKICYGGSITLGSTPVTGHTYTWTSVPAGYSSKATNPVVDPTTTTVYYETEVDTNTGCFAYDNATITVNAPARANGGGNDTTCKGVTHVLGAAPITGHKYSWTSDPAGFTSTSSNPTITATTNGMKYVLTDITTSTGCTAKDSILVIINPSPATTVGGPYAVCGGSPVSIGEKAVAGHTYSWKSNPAGFTSTTATTTVTPTATTEYILTETITKTGCSTTDTATVTANPLPTPSAGGNQTICLGGTYLFGTKNVSGDTYAWTSKPKGYASSTATTTVGPRLNTTYYIKETVTKTGCTATDSATITVDSVIAHAGGSKSVCSGGSVSLGLATVSGYNYSWTSKPGSFTSSVSNPTVSPTLTTKYYLTESSSASGCSGTDSAIVVVNQLPGALTGPNQTICKGDSVQLGDSAVSDNAYAWTSSPAGFTNDLSFSEVKPTVNTVYTLKETIVTTGCSKTNTVNVKVNPLPVVTLSLNYVGKSVVFKTEDSLLVASAYRWNFGDPASGAGKDTANGYLTTHEFTKNKPYIVKLSITDGNKCTAVLDTTIDVTKSDIQTYAEQGFSFNVFPNPFQTSANVAYSLANASQISIGLYDMEGKQLGVVVNQNQEAGTYQYDISADRYHLSAGVYLLKFTVNDQVISKRMVKF